MIPSYTTMRDSAAFNTRKNTKTLNDAQQVQTDKINGTYEDFLAQWKGNLANTERLYTGAEDAIGGLDDIAGKLADEWGQFETQFGGMRDDLLAAGKEDLGRRNELSTTYMDLARPDYAGAEGKAAGDVSNMAAIGRKNLQQQQTSMGIDPSSGASQAGLSKSYLDEALGKATAVNSARQGEKARTATMAGQGIQLFDPSRTVGLAMDINGQKNNLLSAEAGVRSNAAGMRSGLAGSYTQNVTNPAGDNAGTAYGMTLANDASNIKDMSKKDIWTEWSR